MQFASRIFFHLYYLFPLLVIFFVTTWGIKRRRRTRLARKATFEKIAKSYSSHRQALKILLLFPAIFFIVVALARPQWGKTQTELKRRGIDVIFVLDASLSMLAEDVLPNRFEKAKLEIDTFLSAFHGNRVGLVVFSGAGFLQCPLTIDYSAFRLFLFSMNVGYVGTPGTSLSQGLETAIKGFGHQNKQNKAIVLLSDGENHAIPVDSVIAKLLKENIRLYTIGLGKTEGEPLPLKDKFGTLQGHKKDKDGNIVLSKLDEKILKDLARETGGLYFWATPEEEEVQKVVEHMNDLEKTDFSAKLFTQKEDQFPLFLGIGMFFLFLEMLVGERRRFPKGRGRLGQWVFILSLLLTNSGFREQFSTDFREGNRLYEEKKYEEAVIAYSKEKVKSPDLNIVHYNLGNAYFENANYQEALNAYSRALNLTQETDPLREQIIYNIGNTHFQMEHLKEAADAYREVLKINDTDEDAKYNLELTLHKQGLLKKNPQEPPPQQQKQEKKDQGSAPNEKEKNQDKQQKDESDSKQEENKSGQGSNEDPEKTKPKDDPTQDQKDQSDQQKPEEQDKPQDSKGEEDQAPPPESNEEEKTDSQQPPQEQQKQPEESSPDGQDNPEQPEPQQEAPNANPEISPQSALPKPFESAGEPGNEGPRGEMSESDAKRILSAVQEAERGFELPKKPKKEEEEITDKDW